MQKWDLVPRRTAAAEQRSKRADHILASFPLYHPQKGTLGLVALDDDTVDWLQITVLSIRCHKIASYEEVSPYFGTKTLFHLLPCFSIILRSY